MKITQHLINEVDNHEDILYDTKDTYIYNHNDLGEIRFWCKSTPDFHIDIPIGVPDYRVKIGKDGEDWSNLMVRTCLSVNPLPNWSDEFLWAAIPLNALLAYAFKWEASDRVRWSTSLRTESLSQLRQQYETFFTICGISCQQTQHFLERFLKFCQLSRNCRTSERTTKWWRK